MTPQGPKPPTPEEKAEYVATIEQLNGMLSSANHYTAVAQQEAARLYARLAAKDEEIAKLDRIHESNVEELIRQRRVVEEERDKLRKALAGHLFDGESLSLREAIRSEMITEAIALHARVAELEAVAELHIATCPCGMPKPTDWRAMEDFSGLCGVCCQTLAALAPSEAPEKAR